MTCTLIVGLIVFVTIVYVVYGLSDVELNDLPQTKGFKLIGAQSGDETGETVNFAGDVNSDGYPDVIIKAQSASVGAGITYIIFGHDSSFSFFDVNLGEMITGPTTGFRVYGAGGDGPGARSVGAAGDVNGDGIDDFIIGYPKNSSAFVIYGHDSAIVPVRDVDLGSFTTSPETGFVLGGIADYATGFCVSVAGDVNGDHLMDFMVSARDALSFGGIVYVIFGNKTREGDIQLESITEAGIGFRIVAAFENDALGFSMSDAGDVNGDGVGDIIVGAPFADVNAEGSVGLTYVIFGRNTSIPGVVPFGDMNLIDFASNATNGFRVTGPEANTRFGWSVSGLGDINGDSYDDVIISAWRLNIAFVIFGRASTGVVYEDIELVNWDTDHAGLGFRLVGAAQAVSSAGDVNGDGYSDILCSTKLSNNGKLVAYVLFGHPSPWSDIDLVTLVTSDTVGFRILPEISSDKLGISLRNAGDFNSDGYDDVIVSSVQAYNSAGAAYIVFGEPPSPTSQPSSQPSSLPSAQPSFAPTQPSAQPSSQPTQPSSQPSMQPTSQPSTQPTSQPTQPSAQPSAQPTQPTAQPSSEPSHPTAPPNLGNGLYDLDLSNFYTYRGIRILGAVEGDYTGSSVSNAGDVNNDGHPDVIIAARGAQGGAGITYIIYGHSSRYSFTDIDLLSMVTGPTTGFRMIGVGSSDGQTEYSVSAAGDINGDSIDDFMVGAPLSSLVYVIYGHDGATVTQQDNQLSAFTTSPASGYKLVGTIGYQVGSSISKAGDVNGDGIQDLIVNAAIALSYTGITYIIFGNHTREGDIQLNTLAEERLGFQIMGANTNDQAGFSVSDAGDVNGDGVDDFILGAPFQDTTDTLNVGMVYVIFGRNTSDPTVYPFGNIDLGTFVANATSGFRIVGAAVEDDQCGWSVSGIGDFNGDGFDDIITTSAYQIGDSLVILGRDTWPEEDITLETWEMDFSHLGFRLFGAYQAVSGAGDVNGDGYDDIICSYTLDAAGWVYVVYGHSGPSFTDIVLWELTADERNGFRIQGAATGDELGWSVSTSGDFNGDGYDDMIMSSVKADTARGTAYIVYGQPSAPTSQPSTQPSSQPSRQPIGQPSSQPTRQPSAKPSRQPTRQPSGQPTRQPSSQPTERPSTQPSSQPSVQPSAQPISIPSAQPSRQPTSVPTVQPSAQPSHQPSSQPSVRPTAQPSRQPSCQPTTQPSSSPSTQPSRQPSSMPTLQPSAQPSHQPSSQPSVRPTAQPSGQPSCQPTTQPSSIPSTQPSRVPSAQPSQQPFAVPSGQPSRQPTTTPSVQSTGQPSSQPSTQPSMQPSRYPTCPPSMQPTVQPSTQPSSVPSAQPSAVPSGQPSRQPSVQPSAQPSAQPSRQPSWQPSAQPSSQPTRQPSRQPTRQPSGQPSGAPTATKLITTGEWALLLSTNLTDVDATSAVGEQVWVCGGSYSTTRTCVVVEARSGLLSTKYTVPWDKVVSVLATSHANSVAMSATSVRSGVTYSEIAVCSYSASLLCSVLELSDTTFVAGVSIPYTEQAAYMGHYNALPLLTLVEPGTTSGGVGAARSYVYTSSAVRSVELTHLVSVASFAGVFVAGTGNVLDSGVTFAVVVAGWVNSASGVLSAMYVTPIGTNVANDKELVNVIAMADAGPDSFIAGGLQEGSGSSAVMNAYLVRVNALYKTAAPFGVKFVSKSNVRTSSVAKGMVSEGSVVYLLLNVIPPSSVSKFAVLKLNAVTGMITQQMSVFVPGANVSCTGITANMLSLAVTCTSEDDSIDKTQSVVLATNRDLSFKKLPVGWTRNSTISFTRQLVPFSATHVAASTAGKAISTSSFTYSTLGQTPTWRPTVAPTIQQSSRPTVKPSVQPSGVPSGQPSSSPTSAPSISPQPTSHPSTGGPTNTNKPTAKPTEIPSVAPTLPPTILPTTSPTVAPTTVPTVQPSEDPSTVPSVAPTLSPTEYPTLRPTRIPTARPSRLATPAPSIKGEVNDDAQPTADAAASDKKGGITTEAVVIGVSAAGGALAFGCIALMACAACSYKLRKNREKYAEQRKKMMPTHSVVRTQELQARSEQQLLITPPTQELGQKQSFNASREVTHRSMTSDSTTTVVHAALLPTESHAHSDDVNSDSSSSSSSVAISSLHSSEMSDTDFYHTETMPPSPIKSVRRLSEMEAQRIDHGELRNESKSVYGESDDSSIERGFNEIMAEFSDDSSWDSSA